MLRRVFGELWGVFRCFWVLDLRGYFKGIRIRISGIFRYGLEFQGVLVDGFMEGISLFVVSWGVRVFVCLHSARGWGSSRVLDLPRVGGGSGVHGFGWFRYFRLQFDGILR